MSLAKFTVVFLLAIPAVAAQPPLPELRIEAIGGGSVLYIRNGAAQPLTAYLIELVDYPGSSFSFWQDNLLQPIPAGGEKRIQITNMTVGAVPDYVKMQAAVYADGTSSGIPEKVAQLVDRRRALLTTTRELIRRLETTPEKPALIAALKQWSDSMQPAGRVNRNSSAAINQAATRDFIDGTAKALDTQSADEILARLRASERTLAASKPPL